MEKEEKVIIINGSDFGSTGTIALEIANYVSANIQKDYMLFVSNKKTESKKVIQVNSEISKKINRILVKINGSDGFRNRNTTKKLIQYISKVTPILVHIHSIHGYFLDMEMLLNYLNSKEIPVIWTLHDNWAFTGRCAFIPQQCEEFKTQCKKCEFKRVYPLALLDFSKRYFKRKKRVISNMSNIIFVSPSEWNKKLAEQSSIMENKQIVVINNGIDLDVFQYKDVEILKNAYHLQNRFIILCAAYPWSEAKGLSYINEIADKLDPKIFAIVMVGVTDEIKTSKNIIRFPRISSANKMSEFYSMANVFLTPTFGDNYPTVDMESIACGTPVITFDMGGAKEIVAEKVGRVVKKKDKVGLYNAIIELYNNPIDREVCREYAVRFNKKIMIDKYLELYRELIEKNRKS